MEEALFETESTCTLEEYKKYCYVVYRKVNKINILSIVIIIGFFILSSFEYSKGDYRRAVSYIVCAIVFIVSFKIILEQSINKTWKTNPLVQ